MLPGTQQGREGRGERRCRAGSNCWRRRRRDVPGPQRRAAAPSSRAALLDGKRPTAARTGRALRQRQAEACGQRVAEAHRGDCLHACLAWSGRCCAPGDARTTKGRQVAVQASLPFPPEHSIDGGHGRRRRPQRGRSTANHLGMHITTRRCTAAKQEAEEVVPHFMVAGWLDVEGRKPLAPAPAEHLPSVREHASSGAMPLCPPTS